MEQRYENLKKLIAKYNEFKKNNSSGEMSEETIRVWINDFLKQLIYAGNLHKHKSFKNEHEVRITTMDNIAQYNGAKYELKEIGNVVKKVCILKPDIMGNSKKTCFEKLIDEIIVGPRSQQNVNILQQYILSNGLNELANRVIMSDCPLR